jgi:O-antigen/teichoic acid export membrane protein
MASIVNGIGRFTSTAIIVVVLGGYAAGAITGALIGILLALAVAFYQTRSIWTVRGDRFQWRSWIREVRPLTFGLGVSFFMMGADMLVARSVLEGSESGLYAGAGLFGRGLVLFTTPLAAVMFPKIVRAVAYAESTDVLAQALLATAFLAATVAIGCSVASTLLPPILEWLNHHPIAPLNAIRKTILDNAETLTQLSVLIPRFVWAMVPLTLANVLINNLLARQRFQVVPWLVTIAAGYAIALKFFHETPFIVLRTLATFNLLLLLATLYFSFKKPAPPAP